MLRRFVAKLIRAELARLLAEEDSVVFVRLSYYSE